MGAFLSAAFGFPVLLFSVAVVAVVGFWLLVLRGVAERGAFDSDVDTESFSLLSLALMLLAPAAAWWVTRRLVRPLAKPFPSEPGASRRPGATLP